MLFSGNNYREYREEILFVLGVAAGTGYLTGSHCGSAVMVLGLAGVAMIDKIATPTFDSMRENGYSSTACFAGLVGLFVPITYGTLGAIDFLRATCLPMNRNYDF